MTITVTIPTSVIEWLKHGERGTSSETIISYLYEVPIAPYTSHPHDTSDVGRCIKLLWACPEVQARFEEMRGCSPVWDAYVNLWPQLVEHYRKKDWMNVYRICEKATEGATA